MKPSGTRPTQLSVRALHADLLYRVALERRELIASVDDVRELFASWDQIIFDHAVADAVAAGRFTADAGTGRLVIEDDR